jgi:hypothetical protein
MYFPHSQKLERMPEMKKMLFSLGATVALLMVGTTVRADSIPWGYSATSTSIVNSNNPLSSSTVNFTSGSGVASGNSGIIIYSVSTASTATDASPDSFSSVPFNLALTLTDIKATGSSLPGAVTSGQVNFAGLFNATNVTAKSLLPGANSWTSPTSTNLVLGASDTGWNNYNVQVVSFTPPGQPGGAPGSIEAVVTITPTNGPGGSGEGPPPAAPEPASLILAGLGLPLLVLVRRRLKKTQAEATIA